MKQRIGLRNARSHTPDVFGLLISRSATSWG